MEFTNPRYVVTTAGNLRYDVSPATACRVFVETRKQYPHAVVTNVQKRGEQHVTMSIQAPHSEYPELGMATTLVYHANSF